MWGAWFSVSRSALYCCYETNTMAQSNLERKGCIWFTHCSVSSGDDEAARTRSQEPKQRPWKNTLHWFVLHGLFSLLSSATQDHLSRSGTAQGELAPPTAIINQKKMPHRPALWGIFSVEASSSKVTLTCVNMRKN